MRADHHWLRPGIPIRLSHGQHVRMKSHRCLPTENSQHTRAHAAKSPTQNPHLRPIGRKSSRTCHRQRQPSVILTAFMTCIRRFIKAYAVPWQKLCVGFSERAFEQGTRIPVPRVVIHADIDDRVSTQTGRLSRVPNLPIERRPSDLVQVPRARNSAHLICDKVTTSFATSPNQGGIK